MNKMNWLLLSTALLTSVTVPALAADGASPLRFNGEVRSQYLFEDNRDLRTGTVDPADSATVDTRLKVTYQPADFFKAYLEASAVKVWGDISGEDENGNTQGTGHYAELRQAWVKFDGLLGYAPLGLQVGRQRISEPYAFLWNNNIDAARVTFDTTTVSGFVGIAENMMSYRTSDDDFNEDRQSLQHFMGEAGWNINYNNRIELRGLHINDHSEDFVVGDLVDPRHRDDEDQNLFWGNARVSGDIPTPDMGIISNVAYRLDGAVVGGEVTNTTSTAVAASDLRTVTAVNTRDVLGYAFDGDVDVEMASLPLSPTFTLGYAFGSGDDGAGTDTAFRQPDIAGNSSRQGISGTSSHNYGEALRPDLSNLHIVKAGVGVPVLSASDLSFIYRSYWLDDEATGITDERVSAAFNGTDSHVGQEIDVVYNMRVDKEVPALSFLPDTSFRITAGAFKAGDAYDPADSEDFIRARADLVLKF